MIMRHPGGAGKMLVRRFAEKVSPADAVRRSALSLPIEPDGFHASFRRRPWLLARQAGLVLLPRLGQGVEHHGDLRCAQKTRAVTAALG